MPCPPGYSESTLSSFRGRVHREAREAMVVYSLYWYFEFYKEKKKKKEETIVEGNVSWHTLCICILNEFTKLELSKAINYSIPSAAE